MFGRFWDFVRYKDNLLDRATVDCLGMLATGKEMFRIVVNSLEQETNVKIRERIAAMDKQVNAEQEEVRKKVFEHLAISKGHGVLRGLQLTAIVIDLERIGDYGKNMAELVDVLPAELDFHEYAERYEEVQRLTLKLFDLTRDALRDSNEKKARKVIERYDTVSKLCDGTVMEMFTRDGDSETVQKWEMGLALLLRYMKRVSAHLKNIASAIVNPYHRIGFRPAR